MTTKTKKPAAMKAAAKKAESGPATEKAKVGRPSKYTKELAERICERLAEGESLKSVCADDEFPAYSNVKRWEIDNAEFQALSLRAREIGCHKLADQCLEIADDARNDWMERHGKDDAGWVSNGEHIQRSRLRIDTRMRLLGKWLPKVYGEKLEADLKHSGAITVNIKQF